MSPEIPSSWAVPLLMFASLAPGGAGAVELSLALQRLRTPDCGDSAAAASRWRSDARLDEAAARWSRGDELRRAVESTGYVPTALGALHAETAAGAQRPHLDRAGCAILRNREFRDAGIFSRGAQTWIVFAAPADLPTGADFATTLQLAEMQVNDARHRGNRCGRRYFPPATRNASSARISRSARYRPAMRSAAG